MLYLKQTVTFKSAYGINPCYSNSTPSFTWKELLKYTAMKLDYITDDQPKLLNSMRGGPLPVLGYRHVKRGEQKLDKDKNILYGRSMSHYLGTGDFHEIEFNKKNEAAEAPSGSVLPMNERNFLKSTLRSPKFRNVDSF